MSDDNTPSPTIEDPLFEEGTWGVFWTRINEGGDWIDSIVKIDGPFVQAACLAAQMAAQNVRVSGVYRTTS